MISRKKSPTFKLTSYTKTLCSAMLCISLSIASINSYAQTNDQSNGSKAGFLLPLITTAFTGAFSGAASTLFGNIFNKLFNSINCWAADVGSNQPSANCASSNQGSNQNNNAPAPAFNAQSPQQSAQMTKEQAREKLAQAPAFTLKIEKLSSDQPGANVLNAVEFRKQNGSGDLTYDITTGEVFAMRFQTTVPGRVKIINEQAGQLSSIGNYEVIPESDNRMPRSRGFKVNPPAGTEYLHIEYTPCVSANLLNDPRVSVFSAHLDPCGNEAVTKQFTTGKYIPPAGSKLITNLDSPDVTQPILARELNKGEVLIMKIVVNHTSPGSATQSNAVTQPTANAQTTSGNGP